MTWLENLCPIRVFSFYLALYFCVSVFRRWRQYHSVITLVVQMRQKWPRLTELVLSHRQIFLTWKTLVPLLLTLAVLLLNSSVGWFVLPNANGFTLSDLLSIWPVLPPVCVLLTGMLIMDTWAILNIGQIDRAEMEKHFNLAETWLTGWRAPVVHWLSLGYINPRQMVSDQVREALTLGSQLLHTSLWWMIGQTTWRLAFGMSLWLSCALEGWILHLLGAG